MKPRTKIEKKFVKLATKLPTVTDRQKRWAFDNCFHPEAIYTRRGYKVKCLCCGSEAVWDKTFLDSFVDVDQYDCPECGRSMPLRMKTKGQHLSKAAFFSVITTFRGYQLARTFEVIRDNSGRFTEYSIHDIFQSWILDDGKEIITGCPHHRSPFALGFNYNGEYGIKQHNPSTSGYYQMDDLFDICGNHLYPQAKVTPLVRRNGWSARLMVYRNSIAMTDAIAWLLKCPTAEMLCKTGQLDLFRHMVRNADYQLQFLHSVRIANRRGYIIEDASMWLDMLRMASRLGLDTHNPSVVCPADIKEAHDRLLPRIARLERKEKMQTDRQKAIGAEDAYRKAKAAFFGICISDEDININVLPTVTEILEEGNAMHHCVFTMKYYNRPDSLILSARDSKGNRIETVELSLKTFKVLQSRGVCNQLSPHHNRIVSLVESNASLFRKAARHQKAI